MEFESQDQLEGIIKQFVTEARVRAVLSPFDYERFVGEEVTWEGLSVGELMNIAIPFGSSLREQIDREERDYTHEEYLFLNALETLQT